MTETRLTNDAERPTNDDMKSRMTLATKGMLLVSLGLMTGCVNVTAPDKPIVINLNIKITQEVVVRLDGQAKALIESNAGIF